MFHAAASLHSFAPFTLTHLVVVMVFVAATTSLITARRRLPPQSGRRIDHAISGGAICTFVFTSVWGALPAHYDPAQALPLHVCDLVLLSVPPALGLSWRPARTILYFWGLGWSSQGFITPDLQMGPATVAFWLFWLGHAFIVGGAIYDLFARGYRPRWRDFGLAVTISLAYGAIVLPLDIMFYFNYGYVGRSTPGHSSIIDALGPWPQRVILITLLALGVLLLMQLLGLLIAKAWPAHDVKE